MSCPPYACQPTVVLREYQDTTPPSPAEIFSLMKIEVPERGGSLSGDASLVGVATDEVAPSVSITTEHHLPRLMWGNIPRIRTIKMATPSPSGPLSDLKPPWHTHG